MTILPDLEAQILRAATTRGRRSRMPPISRPWSSTSAPRVATAAHLPLRAGQNDCILLSSWPPRRGACARKKIIHPVTL
jgi:hypothetical protein